MLVIHFTHYADLLNSADSRWPLMISCATLYRDEKVVESWSDRSTRNNFYGVTVDQMVRHWIGQGAVIGNPADNPAPPERRDCSAYDRFRPRAVVPRHPAATSDEAE